MRKSMMACSAMVCAAFIATSANAADLGVFEPLPPPTMPAAQDRFCDAYAGVQAGYVWGTTEYSGNGAFLVDQFGTSGKNDGVVGGIYAGCNWNRQGPLLWGIEGDVNLAGVGVGSGNWYGTLRLRAGPTNGSTLFYATGGLAFGQIDMVTPSPTAPFPPNMLDISKPVAVGFAVGGGIEHWFSDKVSWKTEYLYMDLGKVGTLSVSGFEQLSAKWKAHTLRTGVAVHF